MCAGEAALWVLGQALCHQANVLVERVGSEGTMLREVSDHHNEQLVLLHLLVMWL